jgi:hypothetical protein
MLYKLNTKTEKCTVRESAAIIHNRQYNVGGWLFVPAADIYRSLTLLPAMWDYPSRSPKHEAGQQASSAGRYRMLSF